MDGPTCYGAFQEPFAHAFLTATAQLARFAQQNGNMSGVAQFLSERQLSHMIRNFHPGTLTADAAGWRPPFRRATDTWEADTGTPKRTPIEISLDKLSADRDKLIPTADWVILARKSGVSGSIPTLASKLKWL